MSLFEPKPKHITESAEYRSLVKRAEHQLWIAGRPDMFDESERIMAERHAGYLVQRANAMLTEVG